MCRFIFPSDEDDEEGQEGVDTGRVRRPGSITTLHDDDDDLLRGAIVNRTCGIHKNLYI